MRNPLLIAVRTAVTTCLLCGIVYPLCITVLCRVFFPESAAGRLVLDETGKVVGSEWIGQHFTQPAYFWPRPSAAGPDGYDPTSSSGSDLGPTSRTLRDRVTAEVARLRSAHPDAPGPVPIELVTASASGLDPHLSPAAARWQVERVARARSLDAARVRAVVEAHVEGRSLGFLGEEQVNVLLLNLALDRRFGKPAPSL